jgi:N-formylglutamate amidohydrolase
MTSPAKKSSDFRQETGGLIPGSEMPAFTLKAPANPPIPVLICVPHAGRDYPEHVVNEMRDPDFACLRLEDRLIDEVAKIVADECGAALITAHAPRAMLDLNRARDDIDWDMVSGQRPHPVRHSQSNRRARSGLGLIPRRLPGFGEIWRSSLTRSELDRRVEGIHRPYHDAVAREIERIRDEWGCALLIDFHSMPPLRAQAGQENAPQFVLGDRFGTSCEPMLVASGFRFLEAQGRIVAHNRPYAGGYVLDTHSAPSRGLHALQLEVCRSTYLDTRLSELSPRAGTLAKMLSRWVRELGIATAQLASGTTFAQAAE